MKFSYLLCLGLGLFSFGPASWANECHFQYLQRYESHQKRAGDWSLLKEGTSPKTYTDMGYSQPTAVFSSIVVGIGSVIILGINAGLNTSNKMNANYYRDIGAVLDGTDPSAVQSGQERLYRLIQDDVAIRYEKFVQELQSLRFMDEIFCKHDDKIILSEKGKAIVGDQGTYVFIISALKNKPELSERFWRDPENFKYSWAQGPRDEEELQVALISALLARGYGRNLNVNQNVNVNLDGETY